MKVLILKGAILEKLAKDESAQIKIAQANPVASGTNRKLSTVKRWITDNRPELTTATNLKIIKEHFNFEENDLLTMEDDILN